jgi:hypothetical protein
MASEKQQVIRSRDIYPGIAISSKNCIKENLVVYHFEICHASRQVILNHIDTKKHRFSQLVPAKADRNCRSAGLCVPLLPDSYRECAMSYVV